VIDESKSSLLLFDIVSKLRSIAELRAFYGNYLLSCRWRRERIENKKLALRVENEIYEYARSNLAIINIFIKEPYSKRFR
jgi:hypothetical protein